MISLSTSPDVVYKSMAASSVVTLVGGDYALCRTLDSLARDAGWRAETVTSISALANNRRAFTAGCLVLDISRPESDDLSRAQWPTHMPVICITDAGDVKLCVRAMKAGAIDVLTKPVDRVPLRDAVRLALDRSEKGLRAAGERNERRERYATLTRREREVMVLVTSGLMNKQVAGELGISEITVKAHRGRVMRKMAARSLANLVIIAASLQLAEVSTAACPSVMDGSRATALDRA